MSALHLLKILKLTLKLRGSEGLKSYFRVSMRDRARLLANALLLNESHRGILCGADLTTCVHGVVGLEAACSVWVQRVTLFVAAVAN